MKHPLPLVIGLLLGGWILAAPTGAQDVRVILPQDSVLVGEPFRLVIVAEYLSDLDLVLPEASEQEPANIGDFELRLLLDRVVTPAGGGRLRDSLSFEASTFALDTARTAGARFSFVGRGDTVEVAVADAEVRVNSTYREGETPRDLAPIIDMPLTLWPWLVLGLLIAAATAGVVYWIRRRRSAGADDAEKLSLSPAEEALARLADLEQHPVETAEHQKDYAIELSDTIRTYLARRLHVPARERTTREILHELERRGVETGARRRAESILDLSDRIKFARAEATIGILHGTRSEAVTWIEELERTLQPNETTEPIPSASE